MQMVKQMCINVSCFEMCISSNSAHNIGIVCMYLATLADVLEYAYIHMVWMLHKTNYQLCLYFHFHFHLKIACVLGICWSEMVLVTLNITLGLYVSFNT
jgi:hypothetical protein